MLAVWLFRVKGGKGPRLSLYISTPGLQALVILEHSTIGSQKEVAYDPRHSHMRPQEGMERATT